MPNVANIVIATSLITGFSGLVYEVSWQRYLANILGSQAEATALVLAVFLGGLAVGYQLFGNLSRNRSPRSLVKMTGWAEVAIGVWALFFDDIYAAVVGVFGYIDPTKPYAWFADIMISILTIGTPTVLMGVTLPLLTQALSSSLKVSGQMHARIYAVNTGGAFVGCLVAGFWMLPQFGLPLTMLYMSGLNLLCGFGLVYVARYLPDTVKMDEQKAAEKSQGLPVLRDIAGFFRDRELIPVKVTALLAGFCALTFQTGLIKLTGITMGSSEYSFSMVVAAYILLLALGAWRIAARDVDQFSLSRNQLVACLGLVAVYLTMPYWPYGSHLVRSTFSNSFISFYIYHMLSFVVLLVVLYVPIGSMGRTMPLLFRSIADRESLIGKSVGSIYAWNAVGCVAGAYIGGHLMYYKYDIDQLLKMTMGILAVTSLLSVPFGSKIPVPVRYRGLQAAMVAAALAVLFLPKFDKNRFGYGLFRLTTETSATMKGAQAVHDLVLGDAKLIFYKDGPTGSAAVLENPVQGEQMPGDPPVVRSLFVNGKSDGAACCYDKRVFQMSAHLPALVHNGTSGRVGVIGFGTGISVGSFSLYDDITSIDIYEISPTIVDVAHYFDIANGDVTKDPKVTWTVGDAFRSLSTTDKKYSIIMSEPSNPWVAGVERLYTQDFYRLTSDKLEDGGIYAQWFHLYSISDETVGMVVNTFSSVYPHVRIFALSEKDVCLLGSKQPIGADAIERIQARYQNFPRVQTQLKQQNINSADAVLGMEYSLSPKFFRDFGLHSLDIPKLSFKAGMDFYMTKSVDFDRMIKSVTAFPWHKSAWDSTLLSQKYNSDMLKSLSDDQARTLLADVCATDSSKISYAHVSSFARRFCVPLFWSLIKEKGQLEGIELPPEIEEFKNRLSNPAELASVTQDQAGRYLSMITDIGLSTFNVSGQAIEQLVSRCSAQENQNAVLCQVNGIKARIALLDAAGARSLLSALRTGPLKSMINLESLKELDKAIDAIEDVKRLSSL